MSFILDALKKLEREKETRESGVVMVGPVPWGGPDRGLRGRTLALAAAAIVVAGSFFWLRSGDGPAPVPEGQGGNEAPVRPGGEAPGETPNATPAFSDNLAATPPGADATPPPPRDLHLPGAQTTPLVAVEPRPQGLDEMAPPAVMLGTTATPSEPPDVTLSEKAEPAVAAEEAGTSAGSPHAPEFRLTAISSRDGHPIALLNDRLVREGDRFDDVLVLRIGEINVEIEVNGERRTVGF